MAAIQVWTLGANRTPTASNFDAGAKIMLMIDDGSSYSTYGYTALIG